MVVGKPLPAEALGKRDPFADLGNLGGTSSKTSPGIPTPPTAGWNSGENSASASRLSSPVHRAAATPSPSHQPDYR